MFAVNFNYLQNTGWSIEFLGESLTIKQIIKGFNREFHTVCWDDYIRCHYAHDFKIAVKDGQDIWCEFLKIDPNNRQMVLYFYRH